MKYIHLIIILALATVSVKAQSPQPVYSFAKVRMSLDWYHQQLDLWKLETTKNPQNAMAWYYRYKASRNLMRLDTNDHRPKNVRKAEHQAILTDMAKVLPESYEYNLIQWAEAGLDEKKIEFYNKLLALGKNRTEHLEFVLIQSELDRDIKLRNETAKRMMEEGQYSAGFQYYCYNLLIGLPENAIVFTAGDNDTYGCWMLQSMGVRSDVLVVNYTLFAIKKYRDKICKEIGSKFFPEDIYEPGLHTDSSDIRYERFAHSAVSELVKNTQKRSVHVSVTCSDDLTRSISTKMYLCGLSWQYSDQPLDQTAVLKRNFEQKFALDYIQHPLYTDMSKDIVKEVNFNYFVAMFTLWEHYIESGDNNREKWMRQMLLTITENCEEAQKVKDRIARIQN
ncbi:MAG: hypothetical protein KG003_12095 [Bacteroidetes bacterium]|nr:hypothetical protein [Bacteroidota bacterium]